MNNITEFYDNRAYKELYQEDINYEIQSSKIAGRFTFWIGISITLFIFIYSIVKNILGLLLMLIIGIPMIIFGLWLIKESKKRLKELNKRGYLVE